MHNYIINQVTMTSFAITLYSQCCRRHVVGQQVVFVFVACVPNLILICYYACSLLHLKRILCFTYQTYFALQHGWVFLMAIDDNLVMLLHIIYGAPKRSWAGLTCLTHQHYRRQWLPNTKHRMVKF